jgi:hypothetical protein
MCLCMDSRQIVLILGPHDFQTHLSLYILPHTFLCLLSFRSSHSLSGQPANPPTYPVHDVEDDVESDHGPDLHCGGGCANHLGHKQGTSAKTASFSTAKDTIRSATRYRRTARNTSIRRTAFLPFKYTQSAYIPFYSRNCA